MVSLGANLLGMWDLPDELILTIYMLEKRASTHKPRKGDKKGKCSLWCCNHTHTQTPPWHYTSEINNDPTIIKFSNSRFKFKRCFTYITTSGKAALSSSNCSSFANCSLITSAREQDITVVLGVPHGHCKETICGTQQQDNQWACLHVH